MVKRPGVSEEKERVDNSGSVFFVTSRASELRGRGNRNIPCAPATAASKAPPPGDCDRPALNVEGLPFEQRLCNGAMGAFQDPPKRRPGYVHLGRRVLVLITFSVGKPESLKLVQGEDEKLKLAYWNALRLENRGPGWIADVTLFAGSCHCYEQALIINIGKRSEKVKRYSPTRVVLLPKRAA
jgi:hypothetical protein